MSDKEQEILTQEAAVKNVNNAALADATRRQKPSLFTKRMFKLYWALAIATLNCCINGYDGSLMGSINSYPQYREYFGFDPVKGTPATGIVYAIYTIGSIVGSFAGGPAADFRGRRIGMAIGAVIVIIGTIIQGTCHNIEGFMAGRFLLGFGGAICGTAAPAYVSEIAHPSFRGAMTAVYGVFWFGGGIPGTFIPWRTSQIEGDLAWRIPVWLQMVYSGLVLLFVFTIPESPRWLISRGRDQDALKVLAEYHGEGDQNSPILQLEYREMQEDISKTGSDKRWWDYSELFNTRETRYRSMMVFFMALFGQWTGNGPVSYYYPQMLRGAGVSSLNTQLLLQGMQNVVQLIGAISGALITDRIGRRIQLLTSTAIIVIIFIIVLALNAVNVIETPEGVIAKSDKIAQAEIAMIFVFGFFYSAGWTPNQAMYPAECLRYESRGKGMAMNFFIMNVASFYNTFVTGIAFTNAGWKYYFLFVFWDIFEFLVIYFLFVETSQRTLEELTVIFRSKNPVKASKRRTIIVVHDTESPGDSQEEL